MDGDSDGARTNDGFVAVVTGGNAGIGKTTATALASLGAETILACRNLATAETARREIRSATGNDAVHVVHLDLADLQSVAASVSAIREIVPVVDVLVNNAGGRWRRRELSAQGFEATFAVNYLGHYALTRLLLDDLRTPGGRVINVSSAAHRMSRGIAWDDVGLGKRWHSVRAYAQSKLAQILFTRELASRRYTIVTHAVHPGVVASDFYKGDTRLEAAFEQLVLLSAQIGVAKTSEQAASTIVHVATASDAGASTGLYWADRKPARPSRTAMDLDAAEHLWALSESMVTNTGLILPPC